MRSPKQEQSAGCCWTHGSGSGVHSPMSSWEKWLVTVHTSAPRLHVTLLQGNVVLVIVPPPLPPEPPSPAVLLVVVAPPLPPLDPPHPLAPAAMRVSAAVTRASERAGDMAPTITGNVRARVARASVTSRPSGTRGTLSPMASSLARCAIAAALIMGTARGAHAQGGKAPDPAALKEAKKHFDAGRAFYEDPSGKPKCEEALIEFTKAFELSGSLNARKGMAVCNLLLERDGDAIRDYAAYLAGKGASIDPAEQKQIEADLAALRAAVATVRITVDKPSVRITDVRTPAAGFPIRNTYTVTSGEISIGLHPGQHVITAGAEGFPDETWQVDIANGATLSRAFSFKPAQAAGAPPVVPPPLVVPPPTRPVPTSVWVTLGLTGALGVTWGVLAARARILNGDYESANGKAPRTELESMRSGVTTANIVADVFLGAAVAGATTTAILYFTRPISSETRSGAAGDRRPDRASSLRFTPFAGPSGVGATLGGSF